MIYMESKEIERALREYVLAVVRAHECLARLETIKGSLGYTRPDALRDHEDDDTGRVPPISDPRCP